MQRFVTAPAASTALVVTLRSLLRNVTVFLVYTLLAAVWIPIVAALRFLRSLVAAVTNPYVVVRSSSAADNTSTKDDHHQPGSPSLSRTSSTVVAQTPPKSQSAAGSEDQSPPVTEETPNAKAEGIDESSEAANDGQQVLSDCVAVVFGAAKLEGLELTVRLASQGCTVLACDSDVDYLNEVWGDNFIVRPCKFSLREFAAAAAAAASAAATATNKQQRRHHHHDASAYDVSRPNTAAAAAGPTMSDHHSSASIKRILDNATATHKHLFLVAVVSDSADLSPGHQHEFSAERERTAPGATPSSSSGGGGESTSSHSNNSSSSSNEATPLTLLRTHCTDKRLQQLHAAALLFPVAALRESFSGLLQAKLQKSWPVSVGPPRFVLIRSDARHSSAQLGLRLMCFPRTTSVAASLPTTTTTPSSSFCQLQRSLYQSLTQAAFQEMQILTRTEGIRLLLVDSHVQSVAEDLDAMTMSSNAALLTRLYAAAFATTGLSSSSSSSGASPLRTASSPNMLAAAAAAGASSRHVLNTHALGFYSCLANAVLAGSACDKGADIGSAAQAYFSMPRCRPLVDGMRATIGAPPLASGSSTAVFLDSVKGCGGGGGAMRAVRALTRGVHDLSLALRARELVVALVPNVFGVQGAVLSFMSFGE